MSKISKEAKKEEAVKRLEELTKTFNLRPNILKYFKEDKLYYSYITCKGLLGTIDTINYDKRYAEVVDRFAEEYDCLVYHVIETGNTIALLFVSNNKEGWEFETLCCGQYVFAYVCNFDNPDYSEFWDIIISSFKGALIRIGEYVRVTDSSENIFEKENCYGKKKNYSI